MRYYDPIIYAIERIRAIRPTESILGEIRAIYNTMITTPTEIFRITIKRVIGDQTI